MDDTANFTLGDMTVMGRWPAKMMKALAVIAQHLHPAYDQSPGAEPGFSKEACLFSSLAARDFLVAIGFADATARGCAVVMRAMDQSGAMIHSVGVGVPGADDRPGKFNGHVVLTVPSLKLLIDTTLYQSIRPAWDGALLGMFATGYLDDCDFKLYDRTVISGAEMHLADRRFNMVWIDRPELRLKRSPDFIRTVRRRAVTRALIETFGAWSGN